MVTLRSIQQWSVTHHPRWLVIIRVALGLCLFAKGITFMSNATMLERLLSGSAMANDSGTLAIIITFANLLGGFMLTVGLMTRLVCLLQIPILIGAIVFINAQKGGFAAESELSLAIVVLILLIFFLIEGGGPLSLDGYFYKNRGRNTQGTNMP
ncbi:MAG TPA: DoxX family protein [Puia sp.]|nr:DoxX family protein [Puia sp.]